MTTGFPMEFVYPVEGAPALMATANVAKNAPHPELADAFLNYLVGVEAQTVVGKELGFGPVNDQVELTPEEAAKVTYGPDAASHLVQMDWATINEQRPAWTDRWNREIER
jgi:putative spermidine/putrescine transport system substrate-binding protein